MSASVVSGEAAAGEPAANTQEDGKCAGEHSRTPDFFVVGHPKSGTTALYEMLVRHPQIHMASEKEPWFFARELLHRAPPRKPIGIPATLEEYLSLFAGAAPGQRLGEASTTYLWSPSAAATIAAIYPHARIVAILREPASFLRSLHLQFLEGHIESEPDFARALALEPQRREGQGVPDHTYWPQLLRYSEHVRYTEQLRRYHAVFPREQVLVLVYEEFRRDNQATLRRLLRFLGVDERVAIETLYANPTVRPRSRWMHGVLHAVSVGRGPLSRGLKDSIKVVTPDRLRRAALHSLRTRVLYRDAAAVGRRERQTLHKLRRQYAPEVRALSEYLDRDLVSLWGYENVG